MIKTTIKIILILLFSSFYALASKPMTPLDLLNLTSIGSPDLSPNGKYLLYQKSDANWTLNKRISHIWQLNISTGENIQLTHSPKGESSPTWSPDGKKIAFYSKRNSDDFSKIYVMNHTGGEAEVAADFKTKTSSFAWSKDSKSLYFIQRKAKTKAELKRAKLKDDVFAFDEETHPKQLWRVALKNGKKIKLISGGFSVRNFNLSQDGEKILFSRAPSSSIDDSLKSELWIADKNGKDAKKITTNNSPEKNAELAPNNQYALYTSWVNQQGVPYQEDNLFLLSTKTGKSQQLLGDFDHEIRAAHFSKDGKNIYFVANLGVKSELFSYNLKSMKIKQLTDGEHQIRSWQYNHANGQQIVQFSGAKNKGDIWSVSQTKRSTKVIQLTHYYDELSKIYSLPKQVKISWKGQDGVTVEGLLTYPLNYKKGQRYPLVVQTHGGPRSTSQWDVFHTGHYLPVLSAKGYATLQPNYRGGTGYGDKFVTEMVGGYFKQAHLDVMAGVDYLIDQGIADGDKLVKMGWSAGGHMTNKIVTFTNRFKAASSGAGASNWVSMYGQSDTRVYRTPWFGGSPWQKDAPISTYWEHSPLKDVSKVTTPTLVLVGQQDHRVPMPQSVEFYRGMKANGVDTHLYVAPREPHGWRELRHRLFKINVELDWYEKHVMNRKYVWQQAPETK